MEHWPILSNTKIVNLATTLSRTRSDKEHGPLCEMFKSFDITELSKFFYNEKELEEAVKATVEERYWEKHADEFTIWEYLYYDLFKYNLILDVFHLEAKKE